MSYSIYARYEGRFDDLRRELAPYKMEVYEISGNVVNCRIEPLSIENLVVASQKGPEIHTILRRVKGLKVLPAIIEKN